MEVFELSNLIDAQTRSDKAYLEFLRVPSMSLGVYRLPAAGLDPQQPHTEDEVYYIVSGRAFIRIGDEDRAVAAGSIVFVPARAEHRFHSIVEDLTILVFFTPAEYSQEHDLISI